jgi:outer membrane protein assembly factor BamE
MRKPMEFFPALRAGMLQRVTAVSLILAAGLAAGFAVSGCSGVPTLPGLTPYRMEIQQGNFIDQDMVSKLKPGMTREQVRFVLGTPLVSDIFHADRWDYVFTRRAQGRDDVQKRRLSVFFTDGRLARVEGDIVPAQPSASLK